MSVFCFIPMAAFRSTGVERQTRDEMEDVLNEYDVVGDNESLCGSDMGFELLDPNDFPDRDGGFQNATSAAAEEQEEDDRISVISVESFTSRASRASHARTEATESSMVCPLTLEEMREPTYCSVDRKTYERAAIEEWVRANGTSPFTRATVRLRNLRAAQPDGNYDDDDDTASISTETGWPLGPMGPGGLGMNEDLPLGSSGGATYLEALTTGAGGLNSAQARRLTPRYINQQRVAMRGQHQRQMQLRVKKQLSRKAREERRAAERKAEEEDDLEDFIYSQYGAVKGSTSTAAHVRYNKSRFRGIAVPVPSLSSRLNAIPEQFDAGEAGGNYSDDEGFGDDDYNF